MTRITIVNVTVAARNPGSWANDIKVAIIDSKADQILTGISTSGVARSAYGIYLQLFPIPLVLTLTMQLKQLIVLVAAASSVASIGIGSL